MRKMLTNNIGLKIASVIASIFLWMVIVNVDDPVISRSYTGIQVEVINEDAVTGENKTYEIVDGSDTISVVVSAKRSVIENMSRDYIRATADLKQLSFMNTVPIELKSIRYSDQIESIVSRTTNVQVEIEDRKDKQIKVKVNTVGNVTDGYVVGDIKPNVNVVTVSGPESVIEKVSEATVTVSLDGMNETFTNSSKVQLWGSDYELIEDDMVKISKEEITTEVQILETKEVPINATYIGVPAQGYSATGTVICEPSSVVVAGLGDVFNNLSAITIPDKDNIIDDATGNVTVELNIRKYLPASIRLADDDYKGDVIVTTVVEAHDTVSIFLPYENITVENVPEGYTAKVLHDAAVMEVEVSGLADDLASLTEWVPIATIDAKEMVPDTDDEIEDGKLYVGVNNADLSVVLPEGVQVFGNATVKVVIAPDTEDESNE
ncbi:MAG: CdaR family protein [Lachnospiraceae bacterium]|nr:CdaR family protein [Lachnospiraceae bacterium]